MQSYNILITGGTGFIGKALCQMLAQQGHKVTVLTRQSKPSQENITYIQQLHTPDTPFDIIINLAGAPISRRWTPHVQHDITHSRLHITQQVIDYIKNAHTKPELLISGSAIGYYGVCAHTVFDEQTPAITHSSLFSQQLCMQWEQCAQQATTHGVRTVLLRLGVVLEKDGGMLKKLLTPFKLGLGGIIGSGQQWLSWIDRDDALGIISHIIQNKHLSGAINATAPYAVRNKEFTTTLAATLHRPAFFNMPSLGVKLAFGQMGDEIMLHGQSVVPKVLLNDGYRFLYPLLRQSLQKITSYNNK